MSMGAPMTPGARERSFRETRRVRAAELFERNVPSVMIIKALGVSNSAVDLNTRRCTTVERLLIGQLLLPGSDFPGST